MLRCRAQVAIQSMMVTVALFALNLGAVIAVSKTHPREWVRGEVFHTHGPRIEDFPRYALTCRFSHFIPPGAAFKQVERVVQDPLPETIPQIWSPVIASASVTLLVLGLSLWRPLLLRGGVKSHVEDAPSTRSLGWWQVTRWATIAMALVGLNFAAVVHRPPWEPSGSELARHYFRGGVYLINEDGSFEHLRQSGALAFTRSRDAVPDEPMLVSSPAAGPLEKVTTIVVKDDGSVLGYGGRPGEVTSNPIVLRRPLRSPLELWWPLIASTSITALAAIVLWHHDRRNQSKGPEIRVWRDSMRWVRACSLVAWAIIGTALACLNSAGALATWNAQLREPESRVKIVERRAWGPTAFLDENWGDVRFAFGPLATGEQLFRIMSLPRRPTLLQIWSPVLASASVTVLLFMVLPARLVPRHHRGPPSAAGDLAARRSPLRPARWATTAAALIGLNIAGAVYGPFPEPGQEQPCPGIFKEPSIVPDEQGGLLFQDRVRGLVKRPANGEGERLATASDYPLPLHLDDGPTNPTQGGGARVKDTIVYKSDGSVVAYDGNPGLIERLVSRPRVIQPPTRSFLEVWWPVIASVSITILVLGILWCRARRNRPISGTLPTP